MHRMVGVRFHRRWSCRHGCEDDIH
jgi:hypothetical protein